MSLLSWAQTVLPPQYAAAFEECGGGARCRYAAFLSGSNSLPFLSLVCHLNSLITVRERELSPGLRCTGELLWSYVQMLMGTQHKLPEHGLIWAGSRRSRMRSASARCIIHRQAGGRRHSKPFQVCCCDWNMLCLRWCLWLFLFANATFG